MSRARDLADLGNNATGLETLTVSDVTDLSVSASNINSATNQITDSSTDLNVKSNTLVVDKATNSVGIGTSSPASHKLEVRSSTGGTSETDTIVAITNGDDSTHSDALLNIKNAGNRGTKGHASGSSLIKAQFSDATAFEVDKDGNVGIGTPSPDTKLEVSDSPVGTPLVTIENTSANESTVRFKSTHSADSDYRVGASISVSNAFEIYSENSSSSRFIIDSSGNTGIGKTPSAKLDVGGNIDFGRTAFTDLGDGDLTGITANTWYTIDEFNFNAYYSFIMRMTNTNLVASYGYTNAWQGLFYVTSTAANTYGVNSNEVVMNGSGHTRNPPTMTVKFDLVSAQTVRMQIKMSYVGGSTATNGLHVYTRKL